MFLIFAENPSCHPGHGSNFQFLGFANQPGQFRIEKADSTDLICSSYTESFITTEILCQSLVCENCSAKNVVVYLVHNFCVVATGLSSLVRSLNDFSVLGIDILFNTLGILDSIKTFLGFEFVCLKIIYGF